MDAHSFSSHHYHAVECALEFQRSIEQPQHNVDMRLNTELFRCFNENRHIIKINVVQRVFFTVVDSALHLGEILKIFLSWQPWKFLGYADCHGQSSVLETHLESPRLRNTTYISPQIQNEIIDVISKRTIQKDIIEEIVKAQFFSVTLEEVTSHNKLSCSIIKSYSRIPDPVEIGDSPPSPTTYWSSNLMMKTRGG